MSPEPAARSTARIEPEVAWTIVTDAPLRGLCLAREAGRILAWDEADQLYLLDLLGEYRSVARAPGKVVSAAFADDGSTLALLCEGAQLALLDADLGLVAQRPAPPDPQAIAVDPHGRYVLVTSRIGLNQFYNRRGKPAGRFELPQPLAFAAFVPDKPFLVASASYGMLTALELSAAGGGKLAAEAEWIDRQISGVGRLATSGDGSIILASCFTHGVQRYDLNGHNEGSYHLGGTAVHAVPDFPGRTIAVATLEGDLAVLNSAGNVRWKQGLPRPALALEVDPLGRYVLYGHATGEVTRLNLYASETSGTSGARATARAASAGSGVGLSDARPRSGSASLRRPDWSTPVASSDAQAETTVLSVLDTPPRIAVFSSNLRLQLFTTDGRNLGHAPEIQGVGRILRMAEGWVAGATDRQIVVYHAARNVAQRVDLSLVELTHLAIRPDSFGLAVVQERDRVGRATIAGRWVWKQELPVGIEDIAIGPDATLGLTTEDGTLRIVDAAGQPIGSFRTDPAEPMSLIEAVDDAPAGVAWLTLARRSQVLRAHDLRGKVVWESPVPWEGWQFQRLGRFALITAPDGRALAYDGSGHLKGQGKASERGAKDQFLLSRSGRPCRVSHQGANLICAELDGRVRWRAVCEESIGPVAVGQAGVAAFIGRSLAWFAEAD